MSNRGKERAFGQSQAARGNTLAPTLRVSTVSIWNSVGVGACHSPALGREAPSSAQEVRRPCARLTACSRRLGAGPVQGVGAGGHASTRTGQPTAQMGAGASPAPPLAWQAAQDPGDPPAHAGPHHLARSGRPATQVCVLVA